MKWKKILSFMIVSVLVIGAITVISGNTSAEESERVKSIDFGVTFDEEDGTLAAAEGETHLFMHSIDGPIWQGLTADVRAALNTWEVRGSYNNWFINPAHEGFGTAPMAEAVDEGWVSEPEEVRYLANNYDDVWTVNPFAHADIRFAMQYLNRESLVEDLLLGWGNPRYGPMAAGLELWQEHFVEAIEEKYDATPEGNWARVEDFVQNAMEEIQAEVAFGEVTGNMDDGWYYEHEASGSDQHQIEINIMARVEDWREDKGYWTASRLEDLGFQVNVDPTDSASAIPQAFFGSPDPYDDLSYHIYTGGWISTATVYYQEAAFSQMHMPWYGFMQTYGPEEHWQYNDERYEEPVGPSDYVRDQLGIQKHADVTLEEANLEAMDLFTATGIETEDDYWEMMINAAQRGFEESVRVFACTQISLYPWNPEILDAAVPEATNGYDTLFGLRTMRTSEGLGNDAGEFKTDILTGEDRPYMDNWNLEGGSADVYGEYQRRPAREYGTWLHPQTGMPMQVNNYWMDNDQLEDEKPERSHPFDIDGNVEIDFEYVDGELVRGIDIPDDAVDWVPAVEDGDDWEEVQEWKTIDYLVDEGIWEEQKSAVKVTLDVHDLHVWHDGTPFELRDVMTHYANRRELGHPGTEPYREATQDLLQPGWDSTAAYRWNEEEGTVTVWGDYTFPLEDRVGYYFSVYPWDAHPITYYGWGILHAGDDYSFEAEEGTDWIHQLSEDHSQDMISALEGADVPAYLDIDNFDESMPEEMAMDQAEFDDIVASFSDFVDQRDHSFIGIGPYRIDAYDDVDHDMDITIWDGYGFPMEGETVHDMFDRLEAYRDIDDRDAYIADGWEDHVFENGYWSEQFEIDEISFDLMTVTPDYIDLTEEGETGDVDVFVDAQWVELFPETVERALSEDDLDDYFLRLAETERGPAVKELQSDDITLTEQDDFTEFEATMNVMDVETGIYSMEFRARLEEDDPYTMISRELTVISAEEHTLTFDIIGEGTVEIDGVEYEDGDTLSFDPLAEVEIEALPAENWVFDLWTGDVPILDQTEPEITLLMDGDKVIEANFRELEEYELTINAEEGGTTDPEPDTYTYYEGTEVTVEAIPDDDWFFDEWTGDYESDEAVITFEIMEDMEITAWFTEEEPEEYELTVNIDGDGEVEIDPDQDVYEEGTEVTLTATPDDGWEFDEWTGDATGTDTTITITMDEDKSITAVFVEEDPEEDPDDTPGFTLALLVLGAVIAVAIYYKKEQ